MINNKNIIFINRGVTKIPGFNLNAFLQNGLVDGGARPSLFEVRLTGVPVDVPGGNTSKMSFLVQAASIPSSTIDLIEVPYFGRRIKIAGERIFRDWTVTVMNDEDFALRDLFESWSNKINALLSNVQDSTPGQLLDYKIDSVEVLQYGKVGPGNDSGIIRSYIFNGLFPINVDSIALDWSRGNQIETFDVVFAYDYWIPNTIGQSAPSYTGLIPPDNGSGATST